MDQASELEHIKSLGLKAFSGRKQKFLTVTAGDLVLEYCFNTPSAYKKFMRELRKLEKDERDGGTMTILSELEQLRKELKE